MNRINLHIEAENAAELQSILAGLLSSTTTIHHTVKDPFPGNAKEATGHASAGGETPAQESPALVGTGLSATNTASPSEPEEMDSSGEPWDASVHVSTKTKTADGRWRRKPGAGSAPPVEASANAGASEEASSASGAKASSAAEDGTDDEFAAFHAASNEAPATRSWSDADLAKLCNDAAIKLGNPDPIKHLIGEYVGEGQVAHSRSIAPDNREAFAQAVEQASGMTFAG